MNDAEPLRLRFLPHAVCLAAVAPPQAEHLCNASALGLPSCYVYLLRTLQPPFQFVWCMHQARLVAFRPSPLCLWIPQNRIPQNDPSARH